jgi:hypothetical protein
MLKAEGSKERQRAWAEGNDRGQRSEVRGQKTERFDCRFRNADFGFEYRIVVYI